MYIATSDQIREVDQRMIEGLGFPGLLLMETAGRKSAEYILQRFPQFQNVVILVGPGNNGGDGLVIARYLGLAGKNVTVLLAKKGEAFKGDAAENFKALNGAGVEIELWNEQQIKPDRLVVDALLGTGVKDKLRGPIAAMVEACRLHAGPIVAIDLPSGLNASTGQVINEPARATCTITFQCAKVCQLVTPAANYCGDLVIADIGIWDHVMDNLGFSRRITTADHCRRVLGMRPRDGHKGTFGHALLVGGSSRYAGALALSAHAAVHVGAGLVSALAPEAVRQASLAMGPEVIVQGLEGEELTPLHLTESQHFITGKTLGIGPGMGQSGATQNFLLGLLRQLSGPVVLDADALNILAAMPSAWEFVPKHSILTPHPGEMRRLIGRNQINDFRLEMTEFLADDRDCILVLKGQGTIVAAPRGDTYVNPTGNPGMGTGGSGDVLTGAVVGLLAQGLSPLDAAAVGVYVHGLAGDRAARRYGEAGVTASRIMMELGPALQDILQDNFTEPNYQQI